MLSGQEGKNKNKNKNKNKKFDDPGRRRGTSDLHLRVKAMHRFVDVEMKMVAVADKRYRRWKSR
jgi:hypothetical protein